jgi:OFA family oxalate/formate antiporter-like MFS transporter
MTTQPDRRILAGAAVVIQLCLGAGYSWSVFRIPLEKAYGWSYSQTAGPFRYLLLAYTVGMMLGGLLQDRFGPKAVATWGGVLLALGCALGAVCGSKPIGMILGYATLAGLGMGFGYVPALAVLVKWFPDKRGFIVGLAVFGFGAGTLLSAPAQDALLGKSASAYEHTIPFTFWVMAGVFFVLVVGLAQALRDPPEGWTPEGWTAKKTAGGSKDFDARQMLRTWQFYALWAILLFSTSIGLAAVSEAAPYIERLSGRGSWLSAGASVGAMGLCNGVGRLLSGTLSDRFGRRCMIVAVFVLFFVACTFFLAGAASFTQGFLGLCLAGLCFGGGVALMPSTNADYFGAKNVGGNYGLMFTGFGVSGFVGPMVVARVVEAATHAGDAAAGYRAVFLTFAGIAVVGALLASVLRPPQVS